MPRLDKRVFSTLGCHDMSREDVQCQGRDMVSTPMYCPEHAFDVRFWVMRLRKTSWVPLVCLYGWYA